ncbi:hypothetical protein D9613_001005 [Agrocybe pediades]|uniref:Uncharacterized protein n=1 Tax=Agrocybe pediades TaxID=84607 RepID=A0A8H4R2S0_9AGAR|nr:hypothetical protein D9613_001005 [Agrocybe pediades]
MIVVLRDYGSTFSFIPGALDMEDMHFPTAGFGHIFNASSSVPQMENRQDVVG